MAESVVNLVGKGGGGSKVSLLWENPSPSANFAEQDISLSSGDYDLLLIVANANGAWGTKFDACNVCKKGRNAYVYLLTYSRQFTYVSDTKIHASVGYNNNSELANACIPVAIYGIKS